MVPSPSWLSGPQSQLVKWIWSPAPACYWVSGYSPLPQPVLLIRSPAASVYVEMPILVMPLSQQRFIKFVCTSVCTYVPTLVSFLASSKCYETAYSLPQNTDQEDFYCSFPLKCYMQVRALSVSHGNILHLFLLNKTCMQNVL